MAKSTPRKFFASLDIDFFACQVWSQQVPHLRGHPLIVYSQQSGRIISVNNLAIDRRGHRLSSNQTYNEAKLNAADPESLVCFPAPLRYGKSSQTELRYASHRIEDSIRSYIKTNEPSILTLKTMKDEISFDITDAVYERVKNSSYSFDWAADCTIISWLPNEASTTVEDKVAGQIMASLLGHLENSTGFHASVGVGSSLIVAKLAREVNKPRGLTVLSSFHEDHLYRQINLKNAPEFRGSRGEVIKTEILNKEEQIITLYDFKTFARSFSDGLEMYQKKFLGKYKPTLFNPYVCDTLWHIGMGLDKVDKEQSHTEHRKILSASYYVAILNDKCIDSLYQAFHWAAEEMGEILQEELWRNERIPTRIKFSFERRNRPPGCLPLTFLINHTHKDDFGLNFEEIKSSFEEHLNRNSRHHRFSGDHYLRFIVKVTVEAKYQ